MGICPVCEHSVLIHRKGTCLATHKSQVGLCGCLAIGWIGDPLQLRLDFEAL